MGMLVMLTIVEVFSAILQRIFCDSILDKKENSGYLDFIVWSGYFVVSNLATYVFTEITGIAWINIVIFVFTFFFTVRILYFNPVRTLIAVTVFMYLSGMCAELLIYYGKELLPWNFEQEEDLLCTVLSKIVWFFIIKLTSVLVKMKRRVELNIQDWLEVFIVPVGSIWILLSVFLTGTVEENFFGFIAVFMILTINVFTYYLYDKAKENMEKRIREEVLEKQCDHYVRQNRESKEWWEELRQFRHNMNQHYILEKAYLEKKDYDALEDYCNENLNFLSKQRRVSDTGNIYIDSVVNYKADVAAKEGIELMANIEVPIDAKLNAEDISICLGNLLDNAIDAVKLLTDDKIIKVMIRADRNNMVINIKNRYKHKPIKDGENYITNKENIRNHGMGLLIVRQITEKYNGEMIIHDEDEEFDIMVLMYDFLEQ